MTDNLSETDCGPIRCCDACTCENPHRSIPVESEDSAQ